ncbi:MAG: AAA family ATPase [Faecalibacillus intestinalis]
MRLELFSVTNFRSITKESRISLKEYTVLLGKNNVGKTNITQALNIAMNILRNHSNLSHFYPRDLYRWKRDFPINLQNRSTGRNSIFKLEFSLNEEEQNMFHKEIGSKINDKINVKIEINDDNKTTILIPKQGKNAKSFTKKSDKIAEFISNRISINYIPTIRTEDISMSEIQKIISDRLSVLNENDEYLQAIKTIENLEQDILNNISSELIKPLHDMVPQINDIQIILHEGRRYINRNRYNIFVNDGNPTEIEYKGEGIKSLVTIALLKERALKYAAPVIIIEEPESHLHPEAIAQLEKVIKSLAENNQVIVTTHNPLLVVRNKISSNIIVENGKAKPAKNLEEIRNTLGIRASDNLINSKYVLVVEGTNDKEALMHILPKMNSKIARALESNQLSIYELKGAANLSYVLNHLRNMLYEPIVFLDNDSEGRKAYKKAENDNLIELKDIIFTNCLGMNELEFEDCINLDIYKEMISEEYGVDLSILPQFKNNNKWSIRLNNSFISSGKPYDEAMEKEIKSKIVDEIKKEEKIDIILNEHKRNSIDALANAISKLIKA